MELKDIDKQKISDHIVKVKRISEDEIEVTTSTSTETLKYENNDDLKEDLKKLNETKSKVLYS